MGCIGDDPRRADIASTRAFFAPRAAGWEDRFPDDGPSYERAVDELEPPEGGKVLDAACGTGRALPALRAAVGPAGTVVGVDLTAEMLAEAGRRGRGAVAALVLADAMKLPLAAGSLDAVFAAGLLPHLGDPVAGLAELARVCRRGGRLALFHPIGRTTLARRHGHEPDPEDIRSVARIREALARTGWRCDSVDDADDRYLVLATRVPTRGVEPRLPP
ncbi:MAG TPA: class I SAM-dependent methyltransferase [Candidatus Dormibacteraeota bacterium]|nr:class I SAM-dependent methyltransferase [Candidatus Dormibacteraeota bacterium]